nr:ABC transporter substrate-binding protein [Bradyrhizobium sp. 141]
MRSTRAAAKSDSVTFTAYGGSYQDLLIRNVFNPFTKETGIKVNVVPAPELAKIKAQQLTGAVEWDIFLDAGAGVANGSKQGFWEPLDPSLFNAEDLAVVPYSDRVTYNFYPAGVGWDPAKYGPGKHPATFADFFDLKKFPGRRCWNNRANNVLEVALLADGVAPKDVYPLDVDRALKVLNGIKSSIVAWATASPQPITLLQTGEVDFAYTNSSRVKPTTEPGGGTPLTFSFEQNLIFPSDLAVLKNAPNKENAMKLVSYFLRSEVQARVENEAGTVPASKKAATLLSAEARKWQPDMSSPNNLISNSEYWAENYEAVNTRFREWIRA